SGSNDSHWLAATVRHSRQYFHQRLKIMTIDLASTPSKREPFIDKRRQRHHLLAAIGRLPFVEIDDDSQAIDFLRGSKHRRFPHGAFITFTVAQKGENTMAAAENPRRQRHADPDRQAVAE